MCEHFEDRGSYGVGHVALVGIDFQNNAFLQVRCMFTLVLFGIIRVNSVRHISREQEAAMDSLEVELLVKGGQCSEDALCYLYSHIAVCTLG